MDRATITVAFGETNMETIEKSEMRDVYGAKVNIGKQVLFGSNVSIFTTGHPLDVKLRSADWKFAKPPVTIDDGAWIGDGKYRD